MKLASPALNTLLNGSGNRELWMAKCVQLDLPGGGYVLRYTDADVHLEVPEVPGARFIAGGAGVTFGGTKQVLGLEVDETVLTLAPLDTAGAADPGQSPALPAPLSRVAQNGGLDRALVTIWRAYAPAPGPSFVDLVPVDPNATPSAMLRRFTPTGALKWFVGYVARAVVGQLSIELTVRSGLDLLNQPFPRYVYRRGCVWDLYGEGCGVSRAAFTQSARAAVGSTRFAVTATPLLTGASAFDQLPDGYYNEGVLSVVSGANAFAKRGIKEHRGGHFVLTRPLAYDLAPGDSLTVTAGCDRTRGTCVTKFNNFERFRGFPDIPATDVVQGAQMRNITNAVIQP